MKSSLNTSSSAVAAVAAKKRRALPPLFCYMEVGDWTKATDRIRKHPREAKTWATLRTKTIETTKRLPLHHACFKLRTAKDDSFLKVGRFILTILTVYPEAAGMRETRHGCLPLHLACFASGALKENSNEITKPSAIHRGASDATTDTLSAMEDSKTVSVAAKAFLISSQREEMAVQILNALMDAYPKAIRTDSEGGRLPLHTACAGRATPRVVQTLITAYSSAARHRNKDGFLPLHLIAHWGVSHPNVCLALLKAYPDATVGRNRWERTPLEEALCMAGENGRTHQASMVRALRKHPSFWTRATPEILTRGRNIVDMDESLPSNESSVESSPFPPIDRLSLNNTTTSTTKLILSLEELIRTQQWEQAILTVHKEPLQAEQDLRVMTRGGFMSSLGLSALYYACERQPPVAVIEALVQANPLAVVTRAMPGGALPLHVACTWHASVEVVQALLEADPGTTKVTDELGNVALHSACFSGAPVTVIQALLKHDARAVLTRNHQGSRPLDVCQRLSHDNRTAVMETLQRAKESLLRHRRSQSSGTWASEVQEALDLNANDPDDHAIEVSYDNGEELVWI